MEEKKVENALLRREDFRTILERAEAKPNQEPGMGFVDGSHQLLSDKAVFAPYTIITGISLFWF